MTTAKNKQVETKVSKEEKVSVEETKDLNIPTIMVKLKTPTYEVLKYEGISKVGDVILFIGEVPQINKDFSLKYKKFNIKEGDYILKSYGKIVYVENDISCYDILKSQD